MSKTAKVTPPNDQQTTNGKGITWRKATGDLPPLLILPVDGKMEGVIQKVEVHEKEIKKGKKKDVQRRVFYRTSLTADAVGIDPKTEKDISFKSGDMVSLPGSGGFDYTMEGIALEMEGKSRDDEPEPEPDFKKLVGLHIRVHRREDEKMLKGNWAGKKAKRYDVEYGVPELV